MVSEFELGEKGNAIEAIIGGIISLIVLAATISGLYVVADPEIKPLIASVGVAGFIAITLLIAFLSSKGSEGGV